MPLPPQPARVPGASLAAAPPADFGSAAYSHQPGSDLPPHQAAQTTWAPEEAPSAARDQQNPQPSSMFAAGMVPAPRNPGDFAGAGQIPAPRPAQQEMAADPTPGGSTAVSATASVPMASRVVPPADHAMRAVPAPQPRVYGRPVTAEPAVEPGQPMPQSSPGFASGPASSTAPAGMDSHVPAPGTGGMFGPRAGSGLGPGPGFGQRPDFGSGPGFRQETGFEPGGGPAAFGGPTASPRTGGAGDHTGWGAAAEYPAAQAGAAFGTSAPRLPDPATPGAFSAPSGFPALGGTSTSAAPQENDQDRFNAFRPEAQPTAEPSSEPPVPQVRNGRVLLAVLTAAVLILAIPLGLLTALGMIGDDSGSGFNPAIGDCVKQSGDSATTVDCGSPGAFKVVSKVGDISECADASQPHIALSAGDEERILCLSPGPATASEPPTTVPTGGITPSGNG